MKIIQFKVPLKFFSDLIIQNIIYVLSHIFHTMSYQVQMFTKLDTMVFSVSILVIILWFKNNYYRGFNVQKNVLLILAF